jgi:predicted nucleotidyltransferase component of viral defense system
MLSPEALSRHAAERGMPSGKVRGAVREYLQTLILKGIYSQSRSDGLLFLGGTALRLGHALPRFSEDLDFDASSVSSAEWRRIQESAAHQLASIGIEAEVRTKEKGRLLTGEMRFTGFLQYYGTGAAKGEKLVIKLEANRPRWRMTVEPRVVSGYGEMFPVRFASPGLLFAEKIGALRERRQGRDVYDVLFMAGKKWLPDPAVLKARGAGSSPSKAVLDRVRSWDARELARMARSLEPFLFEPSGAAMVERAHDLLPPALEYLS